MRTIDRVPLQRPMCILGVDPGFAMFGFAVATIHANEERILNVGVIKTKKEAKKRNILAADDNFHRGQHITRALVELITEYRIDAISAESMSWPRNAGAAGKMCMAWGILIAICETMQLPLMQASPQRIKKTMAGSNSASKEEVERALLKRYPGQFKDFQREVAKGQQEHGFDACASIVACLGSDLVLLARKQMDSRRPIARRRNS